MRKNAKFVYQDTSESITALKAFLKFRETRSEFSEIKERGGIGFPCIVINNGDKIIVGHNEDALQDLFSGAV